MLLIRGMEHGDRGHKTGRAGSFIRTRPTGLLYDATESPYFYLTSTSQSSYHTLHSSFLRRSSLRQLQSLTPALYLPFYLHWRTIPFLSSAICRCCSAVLGKIIWLVFVELEGSAWHRFRRMGRAGPTLNEEWTGPTESRQRSWKREHEYFDKRREEIT